jgi:L-alanine-DL-glutamate epimerase-like enolase superfamily enzyme
VECDRSTCDVLRTDAYALRAGMFDVPSYPGLGIEIDEDIYKSKHEPTEIVVS